jgi:hypothetical protein
MKKPRIKAVDEFLGGLAQELAKLSPKARAKNLSEGAVFVESRLARLAKRAPSGTSRARKAVDRAGR